MPVSSGLLRARPGKTFLTFFALFPCWLALAERMRSRVRWRFRDERSLVGLIATPLPAIATAQASIAMNVERARSPMAIPCANYPCSQAQRHDVSHTVSQPREGGMLAGSPDFGIQASTYIRNAFSATVGALQEPPRFAIHSFVGKCCPTMSLCYLDGHHLANGPLTRQLVGPWTHLVQRDVALLAYCSRQAEVPTGASYGCTG
jgi:hypothetical protein